MLTLTLGLALITPAARCASTFDAAPTPPPADSLAALYDRGRTFDAFLQSAKERRESWLGNYAAAVPDPGFLERARAVPGKWRLLVVLEDKCSDSVNTIPYVAKLVDSLGGSVTLRVVNSTEGKWVMERHRTPDGRAATPTVVLLDDQGNGRGCFIERPLVLQAWVAQNRAKLTDAEFVDQKTAIYRKDAGHRTVREIVELLESASLGTPRCQGAIR
ncbi:MAG: hypothetical protein HOP28_06275 [Gemmatimonadales bacterium]|nr:hypothetical protein [Gemmatimonadales bacterium]